MNSKNGQFISKLRNRFLFIDLKLNDTVNTMVSVTKALKDLRLIILISVSSGLTALKAVKSFRFN